MKKIMIAAGLAATALTVAAPASAATLDLSGATVTARLLFPDTTTTYAVSGPKVVGSAVEFGPGSFSPAGGSIDVGANFISYFTNQSATYSGATFNGFSLEFAGYTGSLADLVLSATSTFAPVDFSVSGNTVSFNLAGQTVNANDRLDFVAAAPEPATWAMMIVGFGAVGAGMRRRKSKVTTNVAFA